MKETGMRIRCESKPNEESNVTPRTFDSFTGQKEATA